MDSRPTAMVTCELELQLVVPGDASVPLPVILRYDASDPYAVYATFCTGADECVDWVFARDLLSEGVERPAGEGDVRVWPAWGSRGEAVFVALTSPDGQALLEAPAAALHDFLKRTYRLVPDGREGFHLDVDAALTALLSR